MLKEITDTMLPPSNSCPVGGCPPGKFGDTIENQNYTAACQPCPSGRFGYYGVVSPITNESSACKACPRGRYGILPGETEEENACSFCLVENMEMS